MATAAEDCAAGQAMHCNNEGTSPVSLLNVTKLAALHLAQAPDDPAAFDAALLRILTVIL
jgi:hypothetical protein